MNISQLKLRGEKFDDDDDDDDDDNNNNNNNVNTKQTEKLSKYRGLEIAVRTWKEISKVLFA